MFAGRKRRLSLKPLRLADDHDQRVAAFRIVYATIEERLGSEAEFDAGAMSAAAEAVMRHPRAGDDQIIDFLRWFSGDTNPMP